MPKPDVNPIDHRVDRMSPITPQEEVDILMERAASETIQDDVKQQAKRVFTAGIDEFYPDNTALNIARC